MWTKCSTRSRQVGFGGNKRHRAWRAGQAGCIHPIRTGIEWRIGVLFTSASPCPFPAQPRIMQAAKAAGAPLLSPLDAAKDATQLHPATRSSSSSRASSSAGARPAAKPPTAPAAAAAAAGQAAVGPAAGLAAAGQAARPATSLTLLTPRRSHRSPPPRSRCSKPSTGTPRPRQRRSRQSSRQQQDNWPLYLRRESSLCSASSRWQAQEQAQQQVSLPSG